MRGGRVHQIGAPRDIYAQPATLFVASFVGAMNVVPGLAVGPGGEVTLGGEAQRLAGLAGRGRATLAIRPEDVIVADRAVDWPAIRLAGVVTKVTFAGREAYYRVDGGGLELLAHVYRPHERPLAAVGERLSLALPLGRLHAFADDESRIELGT
jgi:ABC-type Fe3+/spermidine/putrescine transport system ATPase subunit